MERVATGVGLNGGRVARTNRRINGPGGSMIRVRGDAPAEGMGSAGFEPAVFAV